MTKRKTKPVPTDKPNTPVKTEELVPKWRTYEVQYVEMKRWGLTTIPKVSFVKVPGNLSVEDVMDKMIYYLLVSIGKAKTLEEAKTKKNTVREGIKLIGVPRVINIPPRLEP